MHFESVTAYSFGRFRDETLELAPGMNVIHGLNEAGKSTWHAALYAGLCGMRRGRGRARTEDSDFRARHRPWDGENWEVGATIALKDRRVVLRHDLDGRVDSSARDADIAERDYSGEIINEGAPDGARWLGLDRQSFLSTACVRQASILAVLDDPANLQDELQSAAATARTGETAADALALLGGYRAEYVGTERAWTRPLARARDAVRRAQAAIEAAREAREEAVKRRHAVEALEVEVQDLERKVSATRAVLTEVSAESAERRVARARVLSAAFPEGEPRHPADDTELDEQVMKAIERWSTVPQPREPDGPTVAELQSQLTNENLQLAVVAEAEASAAEQRLARARELSADFPDGAPRRPSEEDELTREVASALASWDARPAVSGTPIDDLRRQLDEIDQRIGDPPRGGLGSLLRALLRWLGRLLGLGSQPSVRDRSELADRRLRIEREINDAMRAEEAARAVGRAALMAEVPAGSPEMQVAALREWEQDRDEQLRKGDARLEDWEELQRLLGEWALGDLEAAVARLRGEAGIRAARMDRSPLARALAEPLGDDGLAELKARTSDARRVEIESRLRGRQERDALYEETTRKHDAAAVELRDTALAIGSEAPTPEERESALTAWRERRREALAEDRRKLDGWEELQRLLGERTLADLDEEAGQLRSDTDARVASSDPMAIETARAREPAGGDLDDLGENLREARATRDTALGELAEFESGLPDVAEAEESLAAAEAELDRVQNLDRTLGTAIKHLEAAQERVHRDIAPVLRSTVLERLQQVTGGRYVDCRVNPETLAVEVGDARERWRRAGLLSHGTAEQLYLLLRLALARHLTEPAGEACPLILDDVVSAADRERKRELLETLLSISESVQVVLFTHEDGVREWAEERLTGERDRLTLLVREVASI